ncbi:inner membrane protein [Methylomarinovum tepidoasis]|uniref:Inner membrane protein n=1 Tax=Methylomarinovum tepidoasis TaxID=2840183 RepID=A0AAU9C3J3_9GAMM|nr:metal-dependent hydrolase [Methylomarinovum sp. IN45]BCX87987.1 inner membrane protein [Methylomarinovum sp. IN45]
MASVFSHPAVPLALSAWFPAGALTPQTVALGMLCAVAPDLDALGYFLGIPYGHLFGHRGFSHSVVFALLLAAGLTGLLGGGATVFLFLFLSTLSHPLLDAMTNGGLGIAFLSPFSNERFFFPFRPLEVPPLGVRAFFGPRGWTVLKSELAWIWLPCLGAFILGRSIR